MDREPSFTSYRDLRVWQDAMVIAERSYGVTASFPREETFGLISQIRRSAVSIAANVAEGHGREVTGSFIQFLRVAQGSLKELETHLLLSQRLDLGDRRAIDDVLDLCDGLGRQMRALIRSLQHRARNVGGEA